jgi:hypothetical protein
VTGTELDAFFPQQFQILVILSVCYIAACYIDFNHCADVLLAYMQGRIQDLRMGADDCERVERKRI